MGGYGYQKNPYLDSMASNITNQVNDNWSRNIAPSIRSGAMQAGGFGGSRQGVVEANALKDINGGLTNSLTNLYGQDYQTSMGRNLQRYQGDQSYDLGLRNNEQAPRQFLLAAPPESYFTPASLRRKGTQ